ncbi:GGDEF domain-containing protein [Enterococcus columbae]|uniref:GGDEF domain-containing protein n=1 Tax=Enterococcus columbae DSM 7374 = ATCC 51263 TaxID=1121865 RepID=S1MSW8_9ENTE|nr:GGDEF domain-containing protein [Enterococcus columbae]EOT39175.1 hypothetical protein OMW_02052 [Enterococcus columbae DSM 7374 = ATCC 51263]EOW79892.1 hypothetical protein I568_02243 [Enterococcus columbae DSM 7374 = ATCC 51263]OJG24513.1 hypothetical protein RR47_GL000236 [Enterococcus columbae DSM 7374 = ATCC 51263]
MFINVLANISIISLAIYLYFRINHIFTLLHRPRWQKMSIFCLGEVIIGSILMKFSFVVDNIHFDFRFLLIALSFIYIGWRVTIPCIFLLSFTRIFISADWMALSNLLYNLWLILTLLFITKWIKKRFLLFTQMNLLMLYIIFGAVILQLIYQNLSFTIGKNYLLLLFWGMFANLLLNFYITDLTKIYTESTVDSLTKLGNRQQFEQAIKACRHQKDMLIAIIDIDYFKQINDQFGHDTGDAILQMAGQYLKQFENKRRHFYRFGGEEFVCIITQAKFENDCQLLKSIQQQFTTYCQPHHFNDKQITFSQGIALQKEEENLLKTFKRSDQALYHAKQAGRNQTIISK